MKVELIGTGAIYTKYNSACTLINDDMIIDMPNGTLKQLLKKGYDLEKMRNIVITHMHGDHTADLPFLFKHIYGYMKYNNEITVIGPSGIKNQIVKLFEVYRFEDRKEIEEKMKVKYIELKSRNQLLKDVNNYDIQAILVSHGKEKPAYGYIINGKLGLTGDTGICEGVEEIVTKSEITIADSSLRTGDESHMGIDNIKSLTKKYGRKIVSTHLRDKTREELKRSNLENVIVEEDGYIFEL